MQDFTPWIVAAGELVAKHHAATSSPDQLTAVAAGCSLAVAKADLQAAKDAVSLLKVCLALPSAER